MSTLSVDTIQGKTTAGTVAMPGGTMCGANYQSGAHGVIFATQVQQTC